ncbi:AAA family ATPase [Emcibacteraceae bacterium]|nr:AAA family ATPase [Emcibacteraceae bacterium]
MVKLAFPENYRQPTPTYTDPAEILMEFARVLEQAGMIITGLPDTSGKINRLSTTTDKGREKSGWYVAFDGEVFGAAYGNFKTGEEGKWSSVERHSMTAAQIAENQRQVQVAKKEREAAQNELYKEAAKNAEEIIGRSEIVDSHPYCENKGIKGNVSVSEGKIVVPAYDENGAISTIQFIKPDGTKKFLPGGRKRGCYHTISGETDTVYVCEGWATGRTINEATGKTVAVAFDSGNLMPATETVRAKFPNSSLIIAGDDDHEKDVNVGRSKAEACAQALGLMAVFPDVEAGETDFNDVGVERAKAVMENQVYEKRFMSKPYDPDSYHNLYEYDFLVNKWIIRGYVSLVVAPPGVGKSTLMTNLAVSCCSDNDFLNMNLKTGLKCQIINLEDNLGHINNQIAACSYQHNINVNELAERLFVNSTADETFHLVAANDNSTVNETNKLVELIAEIKTNKIDILIIDPIISAHGAEENNNMQMDGFMIAIKRIASEANCAVVLVHHTGKVHTPGDQFAGRGASAFPAKARAVVTMVPMLKDDAKTYDIEDEEANNYVRILEGKNNLAIKSGKQTWFKRVSCELIAANGNVISLPAFQPWQPKISSIEITEDQIQDIIKIAKEGHEDGDPFSSKINATKRWFGIAVAEYLDLELEKNKQKIKGFIAQMIKDNHLFEDSFKSKSREVRKGIFVEQQESD